MAAMDSLKRFVNSKRFKLLLPWVSALVLLAGAGAVMGAYFSNTAEVESAQPSGPAVPVEDEPAGNNIPLPDEAWQVAKEFIFTAVSRKRLAESYAISHPDVKGGLTLKEWKTGEITVPFIPVAKIEKYNWKNTNYAYPRDVQQNVILTPTNASGQRPYTAQIGVTKVGRGSAARWLVSYFQLLSGPAVPASD